jgi:hypothetical protein
LDIVGPAASIEDLDTDFALLEARGVHANNSKHSFYDLPAYHSRLGKASTHDEHVTAKPLLSEDILHISNEVAVFGQ